MGTLGRILLVVVMFAVMVVAMYFIRPRLGIEAGTWQSAVLFGIIIAGASFVWRITAPKDRSPPHSS
jgi:hypothetical protein